MTKTILIFLIGGVFLFNSCKNTKETTATNATQTTENTTEMTNPEDKWVKATVVDYAKKQEGCGYLIEFKKDGEALLLAPMNLDEKYQKDGMAIIMKYHITRPLQKGCMLGMPAQITEIREPVKSTMPKTTPNTNRNN